jgi:two-component system invasion response regulator UvrY
MIKVLLVDDHELVRCGIEALLNAMEDITVVAVCDCGEQALQAIANDPPDVVLMDINMPGMGGVEACRRIVQILPRVRLIGLSVYYNGPIVLQLLKLGIDGFVSKGSPVTEMVEAIRTVMKGKRYLCKPVSSAIAFDAMEYDSAPFTKLSQRELEVVRMILQGQSIQEMSEALQLNTKTVNTYRYRLYSKLKIKNDVELTRLAVKFNYLEVV